MFGGEEVQLELPFGLADVDFSDPEAVLYEVVSDRST